MVYVKFVYVFPKHIGFFVLLLLCSASKTDAQELLKGRWLSHSITYRGKEIELKRKKDKTVLLFQIDKTYVKYYYTYNKDSNPRTLSYNLMDGGIKDTNGQVLKKKKRRRRERIRYEGMKLFLTRGMKSIPPNTKLKENFFF